MKIRNLTEHKIIVETENGIRVEYTPDGVVARVEMETEIVGNVNGIPTVINKVKGHNLPEKEEGTMLLVSGKVLELVSADRDDVIAPNTNEAKRNEKGWIVSVPSFVI